MKLAKKSVRVKKSGVNIAVIVLAVVVILEMMILGVNYYFYYQEKTRASTEIIGASQTQAVKKSTPRVVATRKNTSQALAARNSVPAAVSTISHDTIGLPAGYALDSYTIEKILSTKCEVDSDCQTPAKYLLQSRCPFITECINDFCVVICPGRRDITWVDAEKIIRESETDLLFQPRQRAVR